ncbi:hypothetical protein F8M41_011336 [Gigaspora margarita]|uniref:Uncharacterized protein n=1 Tax=Gigaspora margarita TaxID=4874 RepID=A0A8H4ATZ3_GIGMA|nr:hypothetical protein F8M41_011336 [Gigaspora margarita]
MVKLYKVQPRIKYSVSNSLENEHLVDELPLIEDITSRYYDFIIKDVKFEENSNYQVAVKAKSKAGETHEPIFKVSCAFNPEIRNYVLGVKNTKTEKIIRKIVVDPYRSERVEQIFSPNNSDLLDSTDSSEIVKFCAFAQAIGDNDQLDSNIILSASEVKQYVAPYNVTYVFNSHILGDEFVVKFEGSEGYYEIHIVQVIINDNYQIIKKKETKEKKVIVKVNNLKNSIYDKFHKNQTTLSGQFQ